MSLMVLSWEEIENEQMIPVCQPNNILMDKKEKFGEYRKFIDRFYVPISEMSLRLVWENFVQKHHCCCLSQESPNSLEEYLFSLYCFRILFEETGKKSEVFCFKKDQNCYAEKTGFYYVSDRNGFALIQTQKKMFKTILKIFYYDFRGKFTTYFKSSCQKKIEVRLYNRTIWVYAVEVGELDAVVIKDSNTWYHVKSKLNLSVQLDGIMSNYLIVTCNNMGSFNEFHVLNIDESSLEHNRTNYVEFEEIPKPSKLLDRVDGLAVIDLFGKSVIICWNVGTHFIGVITYEGKQLTLVKQLDENQYFQKIRRKFWQMFWQNIGFIPEMGKMIFSTDKDMLVIFDFVTCQVTQIIDIGVKCSNYFLSFKCSRDPKEFLIIVEDHDFTSFDFGKRKTMIFQCTLYDGLSLKALAASAVRNYFSGDTIQSFNLPCTLIKEMLSKKVC